MASDSRFDPVRVTPFPNRELGIVWADGHESFLPGHALRCACACAGCVDELTGQKTLQDEMVPADVHVASFEPVGNYALKIEWSDGHDTGLYTYRRLRSFCPCGACGSLDGRDG